MVDCNVNFLQEGEVERVFSLEVEEGFLIEL